MNRFKSKQTAWIAILATTLSVTAANARVSRHKHASKAVAKIDMQVKKGLITPKQGEELKAKLALKTAERMKKLRAKKSSKISTMTPAVGPLANQPTAR